MTPLQVLHLIVILSGVTSQQWSLLRSCQPCRCQHGSLKRVDCSRLELTHIPTDLPKDLESLDLSYNNIDTETINLVCAFEFLQVLSLAYNPFKSFDGNTFLNCSLLVKLNLTGSSVLPVYRGSFLGLGSVREIYGLKSDFVELGVFEQLTSLKSLEFTFIGNNAIPETLLTGLHVETLNLTLYRVVDVPQQLFEFGESTLQFLYIHGPQVVSVHADLLRGLRQLKHVALHLPEVMSLPETLFRNFGAGSGDDGPRGLQQIVLGGMDSVPRTLFTALESVVSLGIHDVHEVTVRGLFEDLVNLEELRLSGCSVISIPPRWFAMLSSLKILDIRNTTLRGLEKDSFVGLTKLRELDLSVNALRSLRAASFDPLRTSIRKLSFRSNILKTLDEGVLRDMSALQYLDLSDNKLSQMSPNVFADLKAVTSIELQENKLHFLPKDLFRNQGSLETLDLGENYFSHIPETVTDWTSSLRVLHLAQNNIEGIPAYLRHYLPHLKYMSLQDNPVVCQCQLFTLRVHNLYLFIDAACASPPQYLGIHVMQAEIPENCTGGPRRESGTSQLSTLSLVPSFQSIDVELDSMHDTSTRKTVDVRRSIKEGMHIIESDTDSNSNIVRSTSSKEESTSSTGLPSAHDFENSMSDLNGTSKNVNVHPTELEGTDSLLADTQLRDPTSNRIVTLPITSSTSPSTIEWMTTNAGSSLDGSLAPGGGTIAGDHVGWSMIENVNVRNQENAKSTSRTVDEFVNVMQEMPREEVAAEGPETIAWPAIVHAMQILAVVVLSVIVCSLMVCLWRRRSMVQSMCMRRTTTHDIS